MIRPSKNENHAYDVVELMKRKKYAKSSSVSGSRKSAHNLDTVKTLPQAGWHEIKKVTAQLKAKLPTLEPFEVRRFRIPRHEAVLLELEERGYEEAARYLKELLNLDEEQNVEYTSTWMKSDLKDQKDFIDCLRDKLTEFEEAKKIDDYVAQASALLDAALFFESKTWEWWWIAENLYQKSLGIAELIETDNLQTISLIRYLYGRYLLQRKENPEEALDYLNDAHRASERKTWNASTKLGEKQASIFKEANVLLFKALLIISKTIQRDDPDTALKACTQALDRAMDAERDEYINEALWEIGKSYVRCGDIKRALHNFSKLLAIAKRVPDKEGICNAHMELAFAYRQLDDVAHTERHLRLFRESAKDFGLTDKLGSAHYYTGEYYLSQGKPEVSTTHLDMALRLYTEASLRDEADKARIIAGISKGQELMDQYLDLVLKCGDGDPQETLKICHWKNRRVIFWTGKKHGDIADV